MTDQPIKPTRFVGDDDQKNIDELVAAGIQVDKELIAQLRAENEVLRKALKTIREESSDIGACECAADALADSAMSKEPSHD